MKNLRAYLQPLRNLPIETQREMARDVGITVIYELDEAGASLDSREMWIKSLRPGDVAWVPRLDGLALPKRRRKGKRATTDLSGAIAEILGRGAVIEDGTAGVTSRDGKAWRERVEWAMREVAKGRPSRAKATKAGRKGGATIKARAIMTLWQSPGKAKDRERWGAVWRDTKYPNAQAAADAMPEPLTGRVHLCRRIFKRRDPLAKFTGGRPKTKRAK